MRIQLRIWTAVRMAAVTSLALAAGMLLAPQSGQAQQFYKMSTLGPGTTPYVVSTAFAQAARKHAGVEIQINATGAATRHAVDAAKGQIDFFMSAPIVHMFMTRQMAMYKKMDDAPALSKNLRAVFNFPIGVYHVVTYADSGIQDLMDIKGKKVFLGPPVGAARVVAQSMVEGVTGYKAGEDFEEIKLGWNAAAQAFQDRQFDVYINPTNVPTPIISQIALTTKIRFLGLKESDFAKPGLVKLMKSPGRTRGVIPAGAYGSNQVNTGDVHTVGAWVGIGTHKDVADDLVYQVTKAFFDHLDEAHAVAKWMHVINLDSALHEMNMPLHPGAARYYKEKGLTIPAELMP